MPIHFPSLFRLQIMLKRNLSPATMGFWSENFNQLSSLSFSFHQFGTSRATGELPIVGHQRLPCVSAKAERNSPEVQRDKCFDIKLDLVTGKAQIIEKPSTKTVQLPGVKDFLSSDVKKDTAGSRYLERLATIFVFDIETTGFGRDSHRIIEFALRDLLGGPNSTFQTLVNPERYVPNTNIHGISNYMVRRPGVPRWKDLIPILIQYVNSRQKPGRPVLWIAHNGRRFDVPFMLKEFDRCSIEIPSDWLFLDTLYLARELVKPDGSKLKSMSLEALRMHYDVPQLGNAHRAMSDVDTLSLVLQRLTHDLKLPVSGLLDRSFKASDLTY
ncbi:Exonuclease [Nymphaea thermarum]|nr:Exonuclease [Nymphaea thermarum]